MGAARAHLGAPAPLVDGQLAPALRAFCEPTAAAEQCGATLARWFGSEPAKLAATFPHLAASLASDPGLLGRRFG